MTDPRISFVDSVSTSTIADLMAQLSGTRVRLEVTPSALATLTGQALMYQLATLTARLFDHVELLGDEHCPVDRHFCLFGGPFLAGLRAVLLKLRPIALGPANDRLIHVLVGADGAVGQTANLFVGAGSWEARVSTSTPQAVEASNNPCGALAAGALGAAEVFKLVFDRRVPTALSAREINLSLLTYSAAPPVGLSDDAALPAQVAVNAALIGCGSIGCAFLLGLLLTPVLSGRLTTVDNGTFDVRNPFKYTLLDQATAQRQRKKALWAFEQILAHSAGTLAADAFVGTAYEYVAGLPEDYRIDTAVSAVDSMEARLEIQDILPRRIVNAGISGTVVEVSSHGFGTGACLGCLTLKQDMESWSAEFIATRTGLTAERVQELILSNGPITRHDADAMIVASKLSMELILELDSHVGQPLLSFVNRMPYAETAVNGPTGPGARVTTAFVSAFAGAILFAEFLKGSVPSLAPYRVANSYRHDMIGIPGDGLFRHERDQEGWCACHSAFRLRAYAAKYGTHTANGG